MKYSATFFILGGLVTYLALSLGGWWYLLCWFAFSCFALAVGYAGLDHRVFGKRFDGRIPLWSKTAHFPYMLYSAVLWHIVRLLSRENPTDSVSDNLILGRRLHPAEVPAGIANYVDLTAEMEDPAEIRASMHYVCLPILDAGIPSAEALESAVSQLVPGRTFVHCAQGHGRTGLFALALLARCQRISSLEEGMALVKSVRPGIVLNRRQERFIRDYIAKQANSRDGS